MEFTNGTIYSGLSSTDYQGLWDLGISDLQAFLLTLSEQPNPEGGTWFVYTGDDDLMLLISDFTEEEFDLLTYAYGNSTWVLN